MKIHITITDEKVKKGLKEISLKNQWSMNKIGNNAIKFYLKARRILKE